MPTYELKCPRCGHRFETFATMKQRDAIACPACAQHPVEKDYTNVHTIAIGVREFAGFDGESRIHHFLSNEVGDMRRELGESGSCIRDDGSVVYANKGQAERFNKSYADWRDRTRSQRREAEGRLADKVVRGDATKAERATHADTEAVNGRRRRRKQAEDARAGRAAKRRG